MLSVEQKQNGNIDTKAGENTALRPQITVEIGTSEERMVEAVELAKPDVILAPFLTKRVLRLGESSRPVLHPGPPGDDGPSSLEWLLMGDDGGIEDPKRALVYLTSDGKARTTTKWWGDTVFQAVEELQAGPVWATSEFALPTFETETNPLSTGTTSPHTASKPSTSFSLSPHLSPPPLPPSSFSSFFSTPMHSRRLLKPSEKDFDPFIETATSVSRKLRALTPSLRS
ncbi:hypothetical protein BT69DRAFT_1329825 [Atractiella rhizophila]|nr:hypothetical protein BT69DRAFT_1329825 [Atractiella rhizophila]